MVEVLKFKGPFLRILSEEVVDTVFFIHLRGGGCAGLELFVCLIDFTAGFIEECNHTLEIRGLTLAEPEKEVPVAKNEAIPLIKPQFTFQLLRIELFQLI